MQKKILFVLCAACCLAPALQPLSCPRPCGSRKPQGLEPPVPAGKPGAKRPAATHPSPAVHTRLGWEAREPRRPLDAKRRPLDAKRAGEGLHLALTRPCWGGKQVPPVGWRETETQRDMQRQRQTWTENKREKAWRGKDKVSVPGNTVSLELNRRGQEERLAAILQLSQEEPFWPGLWGSGTGGEGESPKEGEAPPRPAWPLCAGRASEVPFRIPLWVI